MSKRNEVRDGHSAAPTKTIRMYDLKVGDMLPDDRIVVGTIDNKTCVNHVHINDKYCFDAGRMVRVL